MVMNPTALIHIPGDNMQIEIFIREYCVAHIVFLIEFYVGGPVGTSVLAQ